MNLERDAVIPALGNTKQEPEKKSHAKYYSITIFGIDEVKGRGRMVLERIISGYKTIDKAVWQTEKAPTTGELHVQAAIAFVKSDKRNWDKIKKVYPQAHIEVARKFENLLSYCCKAESRVDGPWFHNVDPKSLTEWGSIEKKIIKQGVGSGEAKVAREVSYEMAKYRLEQEAISKITPISMYSRGTPLWAEMRRRQGLKAWFVSEPGPSLPELRAEEERERRRGKLEYDSKPQSPVAPLPLPVEADR